MEHLTTTPFGRRPVTAGLLARAQAARSETPLPRLPKWPLFRQLATARKAFDLSDRDLTVLSALLSFLPGDELDADAGLIAFPSNATLSARCHGMAESTLRRHLATLVSAGMLLRHDSPNGKRYAAKRADGSIYRAFGFNLRPLLERAQEIAAAAECETRRRDAIKREREAVMCLKRDAIKLLDYARDSAEGPWEALSLRLSEMHRLSRRKLSLADWQELRQSFETLVENLEDSLCATLEKAEEPGGTDSLNERQYQSSDKDTLDSEPAPTHTPEPRRAPQRPAPTLPITTVVAACPDIAIYAESPPRQWHDLVIAATRVYPMMGITAETWEDAKRTMGAENAAVTIAAMLQRIGAIKAPGGYLRTLANKARSGKFSPMPMVMALTRAGAVS